MIVLKLGSFGEGGTMLDDYISTHMQTYKEEST